MMNSQVEKILDDEVVLTHEGSPVVVPNDFVIVCIGGDLPLEFLTKAGVSVRRHFSEERAGPAKVVPRSRRGLAKEREEGRGRRNVNTLYFLTGLLIVAWLAFKGWDYYLLPRGQRIHSPLHGSLRAAGSWGQFVGIVATAFMLLNFLYPLRKRSKAMSGLGSIRGWLDFHMFVGFMSPLVITLPSSSTTSWPPEPPRRCSSWCSPVSSDASSTASCPRRAGAWSSWETCAAPGTGCARGSCP